jgi:hypothetical protein
MLSQQQECRNVRSFKKLAGFITMFITKSLAAGFAGGDDVVAGAGHQQLVVHHAPCNAW